MSEVIEAPTETEQPKRRNKIAEEKARLREQLAALVDKVPPKVNAGSVQTTHEWVEDNKKVQAIARGGKKRMSRHALSDALKKMEAWRSEGQAA